MKPYLRHEDNGTLHFFFIYFRPCLGTGKCNVLSSISAPSPSPVSAPTPLVWTVRPRLPTVPPSQAQFHTTNDQHPCPDVRWARQTQGASASNMAAASTFRVRDETQTPAPLSSRQHLQTLSPRCVRYPPLKAASSPRPPQPGPADPHLYSRLSPVFGSHDPPHPETGELWSHPSQLHTGVSHPATLTASPSLKSWF